MRAIISSALPLGVLLAAAALGPAAARSAASPTVGQPAPALIATSFNGQRFSLADLRGKVVVLNFWASWCGPCLSEMPMLEETQRKYRDQGVVIVGFSADDRHDRKEAIRVAQGVSYLTGLLSEAQSNGFGMPQVLPLTFIIDAKGTIAAVLRANQGALSAEQMRAALETALRGSTPAAGGH